MLPTRKVLLALLSAEEVSNGSYERGQFDGNTRQEKDPSQSWQRGTR